MTILRTLALSATITLPLAAQSFGAIYTLTNDAGGNAVAVSLRLPTGTVLPAGTYATGGTGTGAGLGSQQALADTGNHLVVVDPGSDEVTLFRTLFDVVLWRTATVPSGGDRPTSVTARGNLVYVLNADSDTVAGFRIVGNALQPIAGAVYPLSQSGAAGAQVGISPDGHWLAVTEKATNRIDVFRVHPNGTLGQGQAFATAGSTPFGFAFRQDGTLVVSEAAGGGGGASTVSSYRIRPDGTLVTLTGALPTTQTAACWIALPRNGRFAYSANTPNGTIGGFALVGNGQLGLLPQGPVAADLGSSARPLDFEFDPQGRYLYVLETAADEIVAFRRHQDGSLTRLPGGRALADGAAGLLVR